MAESIQQLLRQESIAPTEVARFTPDYKTSEFRGGGLQLGAMPALPAVSSEELQYRNLAAIAGGVGQSIDIFGQIASQIDKSTLEEVQAKFNSLDAEEIDPRVKLKKFTEIVDGTTTIVSPNTWETNIMAEANKRFGRKALNEYTIEKLKQDATKDPTFGGDIEDEEFLGRFLPKWKNSNPTLSYTDPIKTLDGKLVSQARERDRQLFLITLTETFKQELNLSEELVKGLQEGTIPIEDPRFTPQFVELWNSAQISQDFKDFSGYANSTILTQLKNLPGSETLPPRQLEILSKGIMKEIGGSLNKIWQIKTDVALSQERQVKDATYKALQENVLVNPTKDNLDKFVSLAKSGYIPRSDTARSTEFAVRVGEAIWGNLEKEYVGWNLLTDKKRQSLWEDAVTKTLTENWNFNIPVNTGIQLALNLGQTRGTETEKPRLINMNAASNIKSTIEASSKSAVTSLVISGKTPEQAYRDILLDVSRKYLGFNIPPDSPELKALDQLIFEEVKDESGNIIKDDKGNPTFQISSNLSSEKVEQWKQKFPNEFKTLKDNGFEVTKDTVDTLRESWKDLTTEYSQVMSARSRENSNAGTTDPKHYSETSIRQQVVTDPKTTLARVNTFFASLKDPSIAVTPEVAQTARMALQMEQEALAAFRVASYATIVNLPDTRISEVAAKNGIDPAALKLQIEMYKRGSAEARDRIMNDPSNPLRTVSEKVYNETFGTMGQANPYIEWIQATSNATPVEIVNIAKNIQEKLNNLEPGSPEYAQEKTKLNQHLALWEYHLGQIGSTGVSSQNPLLVDIRESILSLLTSKSIEEMVQQGQTGEAAVALVAVRALASQNSLQAVLGSQNQNDVKYLRVLGSALGNIPGVYSPEFMLPEYRRVIDSMYSTLTQEDTAGITGPIPVQLRVAMKRREGEAISRADVGGFVLNKVVQIRTGLTNQEQKDRTKVMASLVTGDWSFMEKSDAECGEALKTFLSSVNFELGGIPMLNASSNTYTYQGKTETDALVDLVLDSLDRTSSQEGINYLVRMGTAFSFPGTGKKLNSAEMTTGWRLIFNNIGPNPTVSTSFVTERNDQTGVPNLIGTSSIRSPNAPNSGFSLVFNNFGLTGDFSPRVDGKPTSFPSGMPQTIPFNDKYEDESLTFSPINYGSSISRDYFMDDDQSITTLTLEEIDDTFNEVFKSSGPNQFGSRLIDRISPEQGLIVSVLSMPATPDNVLIAAKMLNIPIKDMEEFTQKVRTYNQSTSSVLSFLTSVSTGGYYSEFGEVGGVGRASLATDFVFPLFEPGVDLKQTFTGSRNNPQFYIQPVGSMYREQKQSSVVTNKRVPLNVNGFPDRPSYLNDVHSLPGQQQRARLQLTLLQLADWQSGRSNETIQQSLED